MEGLICKCLIEQYIEIGEQNHIETKHIEFFKNKDINTNQERVA